MSPGLVGSRLENALILGQIDPTILDVLVSPALLTLTCQLSALLAEEWHKRVTNQGKTPWAAGISGGLPRPQAHANSRFVGL